MMRAVGIAILALITAAVVVILYAPLAVVIIGSVVPTKAAAFDWSAASFDAFAELAESGPIIRALMRSLFVSTVAVLACRVRRPSPRAPKSSSRCDATFDPPVDAPPMQQLGRSRWRSAHVTTS